MRTVKVETGAKEAASAIFSVAFSPGKVEEVKFVSGARSLESIASQLAIRKFNVEFPDESPTKLIRRGMLKCGSTGCDFAMLLPDSVHTREDATELGIH